MSEHTKTPWELSRDSSAYMEGTLIIDPIKDAEVAGVWKDEDARHIVHCVNNHDRLVEALRVCAMQLDDDRPTSRCMDNIASDSAWTLLSELEAGKGGER